METNSAGQDNVGKIILAIISFIRLKANFPNDYIGGLLVIDELDATMYPGSQNKLLGILRKYASELSLQVVFTTHSLSLLEEVCKLRLETSKKDATKEQIKLLYLIKNNKNIIIKEDQPFQIIKHLLNVTISPQTKSKIWTFTEDNEGMLVTRSLVGSKSKFLHFVKCTASCSFYIDLLRQKVPPFIFPNSIIILDGDVNANKSYKKVIKSQKNVILLPNNSSPEVLLSKYLFSLDDDNPLWQELNPTYSRQVCFKDYNLEDISHDRKKAKEWFCKQREAFKSRWLTCVIKHWKKDNKKEFDVFINDFTLKLSMVFKENGFPELIN